MEFIDIAEFCRACQINTEDEAQKIFLFNTVKLPDIFKETTSLDIHENDGLPKVLCFNCFDRLMDAYKFRKMCSASSVQFQKILSMDDVPEVKYTPPEDLSDPFRASGSHLDIYSEKISTPLDRIPEVLIKDPALPEKLRYQNLATVDRECAICNLIFLRKEGLEKHMIAEHLGLPDPLFVDLPPEKKNSPPDRKDSSLESPNSLPIDQNPLASHDEDDSDDAPLIARKTKNRQKSSETQKKKRAQKMKHWRGQPLFECCLCNSTFRQKIRVEVHMRKVHLGLTPCVCKICGLGLTRLEGLKHHMKTHEKGKRYPCRNEGCSEKYENFKDLLSHLQTSHDEKLWSCEFCPYKTDKSRHVTRHEKMVHEKVRDYHCPYCKRAFGYRYYLKKHMKIHKGEKLLNADNVTGNSASSGSPHQNASEA